jgi:riboflavin kinase, archaea type
MEIKGKIISGMGKGTYFMSQDIYVKQFQEKLKFRPFVGTLNIKLEEDQRNKIMKIPHEKFGLIHGKDKFGDVKFIKAVLNKKIVGALVFPAKTKHTADVLEFISNENLRISLKLKDGDLVLVDIED